MDVNTVAERMKAGWDAAVGHKVGESGSGFGARRSDDPVIAEYLDDLYDALGQLPDDLRDRFVDKVAVKVETIMGTEWINADEALDRLPPFDDLVEKALRNAPPPAPVAAYAYDDDDEPVAIQSSPKPLSMPKPRAKKGAAEPERPSWFASAPTSTVTSKMTAPTVGQRKAAAVKKTATAIRQLITFALTIAVLGVICVALNMFVVTTRVVTTSSMSPLVVSGDRIVVNKLGTPSRGKIVWTKDGQLERVIALPGDTIEGHDGKLFLNGAPYEELYLPEGTVSPTFGPTAIKPNQVWLMTDDRKTMPASAAARSELLGTAEIILMPFSDTSPL